MRRCIRCLSALLLLAQAAAAPDGNARAAIAQAGIAPAAIASGVIDATRTTYLTRCGGCHGIEGASASAVVPNLRDQVGLFLCTGEGRRYMLRVPNIAMSMVPSDSRLAAVMNFVVFDLGGASTPPGTPPFTAGEIHDARLQPLRSTDMAGLRRGVLQRAVVACAAHG